MKKTVLLLAGILLALAAVYLVGSGFLKNGSVYIDRYSVSADGRELTVTIGVASSVGTIRKLAAHPQADGTLSLDCYAAFGGINGSIGAKAVYTVPLEEGTVRIALYRERGAYEPVLQKGSGGGWQRVNAQRGS